MKRAHALVFLGRADEARAIYLNYRGVQNLQHEKSWVAICLDDFAQMHKAALSHPLMDEIEKQFSQQ
jgi:hypothetical protein